LVFQQIFEPIFVKQFWQSKVGERYKLERSLTMMLPTWPLSTIAKMAGSPDLLKKIVCLQKIIRGHLLRISKEEDIDRICTSLEGRFPGKVVMLRHSTDQRRQQREDYRAKQLKPEGKKKSKKKRRGRRDSTGASAWLGGMSDIHAQAKTKTTQEEQEVEPEAYEWDLSGYDGIDEYGYPWRIDEYGFVAYLDHSGTEFYMQEDGNCYFLDAENNAIYFLTQPPAQTFAAAQNSAYDMQVYDSSGNFDDTNFSHDYTDADYAWDEQAASFFSPDTYENGDISTFGSEFQDSEYSQVPDEHYYEDPSQDQGDSFAAFAPYSEEGSMNYGAFDSVPEEYQQNEVSSTAEDYHSTQIQRVLRGFFARQYTRRLLQYVYTSFFDDDSGLYYYQNNYSGETSWYPPSFITVQW
jgi:hypothetical protein